jgi:sulfate adenylyltransferase subunit 1 (EFTu-like GTPase family)
MDAVNWDESAYNKVVEQINTIASELDIASVKVIPVSALIGDNVVERSANSPWYNGQTVIEALETSDAGAWAGTQDGARLPIQWVLRQNGGGRTYAGMLCGHTIKVGDKVTLLPQGVETTVKAITNAAGPTSEAGVGLSIDIDLEAETDAGRGDMIATAPLPTVSKEITATICWFGDKPLASGQRLRLKHTSKVTPVRIAAINGVVDIETLKIEDADSLTTNQIGLANLQTADPIVVDDYREGRVTGSFVLIDEVTNATVAAGMVGRASFF